jgi:hypothetical protein
VDWHGNCPSKERANLAQLPSISLTDKQAQFVERILSGETPTNAAKLSGLSVTSTTRLLSAPNVLAAIEIGLRKQLHGELVPLAFAVFKRILTAEPGTISERVQADVAAKILDRGGFVPVKQSVAEDGEREPAQMTTQELLAKVEELEREIAERATPIAPSDGPEDW